MSLPIFELLVEAAVPVVGPVFESLCAVPRARRTKKKRQAIPHESLKSNGQETLIGGEQQRNGLQIGGDLWVQRAKDLVKELAMHL
jgi:hypothetical protein